MRVPSGGPGSRRGRVRLSAAALALALASVTAATLAQERSRGPDESAGAAQERASFPHEEHQGLFPFCTGCHAGAETGEPSELYPEPGLCARCHDGEDLERVSWTEADRKTSNLRFTHREHARAARADTALACRGCHSARGAARMAVRRAVPGGCLGCHAHRAEEHLADAECTTCHRPLAETGFALARIEELPVPESHERADFLAEIHGGLARGGTESCATCHTAERCTSCHVDALDQSVIAAIPAAPSGMHIPAFEARYPTPDSHLEEAWLESHGGRASTEACSTCHTRQSCRSCHSRPGPEVLADLPSRGQVTAAGVAVRRRPPPSHGSPFFSTDHGSVASADPDGCTTCHSESSCTECHGSDTGAGGWGVPSGDASGSSFHPPDYLRQHAADAYGSRFECSNCHSTAVFCRDCHEQMGMGSSGRLGAGYHDAQPLWLFRHGQAARQGLESCASCHQQQDCMQCHSTVGSFRVNPHGRDFNADRYAERNRAICLACHLRDPLGGEPGGGG